MILDIVAASNATKHRTELPSEVLCALEAQAQAAVQAERRKAFIAGYIDLAKRRYFEATGFTCWASEIDAFEVAAAARWEQWQAIEARFGEAK